MGGRGSTITSFLHNVKGTGFFLFARIRRLISFFVANAGNGGWCAALVIQIAFQKELVCQ